MTVISTWRRGLLCALLAAVTGLLSPAPGHPENTRTINNSEGYVDASIATAFVSVPGLCAEPLGSGATTTGCDALGAAAVAAAGGTGADPYWGTDATATGAFVPAFADGADSGNRPAFSQHQYDLFGRGTDVMGPFNREEILFLTTVSGTGAMPQTEPGTPYRWDAAKALLTLPQGQTTITAGGITFNIADLRFYTELTGLTAGGAGAVNGWCIGFFNAAMGPGSGALICPMLSAATKAEMYLNDQAPEHKPNRCAGSGPGLSALNCQARDQWISQVVTGYVEAWASLGGSRNFTQNLRSQMVYEPGGPLTAATLALTDFRLEQSVELGQNAFEASRQTFQTAMATAGTDAGGTATQWGQLVSQDVIGYFYSCLNCDSAANTVAHAFTPMDLGLTFMPYQTAWRGLPSIGHGASGGNLTAFALPGEAGP